MISYTHLTFAVLFHLLLWVFSFHNCHFAALATSCGVSKGTTINGEGHDFVTNFSNNTRAVSKT